jgi:hypothetical protein
MLPADDVAYIRDRFAASSVTLDPSPHLVIRDVLPPDVYRRMQNDYPSTNTWLLAAALESYRHHRQFKPPHLAFKEVMGRIRRVRRGSQADLVQPFFSLRHSTETNTLLRWQAARWKRWAPYIDLIDELTAETFQPEIDRYQTKLISEGLLKHRVASTPGQSLVCERIGGWTIAAHSHDMVQTIQSMIYFPLPGSSREQGTSLYRLLRPHAVDRAKLFATYFPDKNDIEPTALMEYHPNTLASFLNTPAAIHSAPEIAGQNRRYIFTGSRYPHEAFNEPSGSINLSVFTERALEPAA